jgi:hypothetical protein
MGTGFFPGVKWPRRGVDKPLLSSAEVKKRVELYLYSPIWASVTCCRVNFIFYLNNGTTIQYYVVWITDNGITNLKLSSS